MLISAKILQSLGINEWLTLITTYRGSLENNWTDIQQAHPQSKPLQNIPKVEKYTSLKVTVTPAARITAHLCLSVSLNLVSSQSYEPWGPF